MIPAALSNGEEEFAQHLGAYKIPFEREVQWHPKRKWRADFSIQRSGKTNILVEVEGGTAFGKSRHSRGKGFDEDARKYNTAALMGITVLRFSTAMVRSGEAIDTVREVLGIKGDA